jgi:hypothetical protein
MKKPQKQIKKKKQTKINKWINKIKKKNERKAGKNKINDNNNNNKKKKKKKGSRKKIKTQIVRLVNKERNEN